MVRFSFLLRSRVLETSADNVTTNIMTSLLTRRGVERDATGTYTCQDQRNPRNHDRVVVTVTEQNVHRGKKLRCAADYSVERIGV